MRVAGRLTWRDASGTLRFVSVVTRDVSDVDAFVECQVPASIPLYRLVHFQIERPARDCSDLPAVLQQGKVLSAVYRVGPYKSATGTPQGYALRLLVEPTRQPPRRGRATRSRSRTRSGSRSPAREQLARPRAPVSFRLAAVFRQYRASPSHSSSSGAATR